MGASCQKCSFGVYLLIYMYVSCYQNHYYQPLWTLVGGGIERLEESMRPTGSLIPNGCTWLKTKAAEFKPDKNIVITADGDEVTECFCFLFTSKLYNVML